MPAYAKRARSQLSVPLGLLRIRRAAGSLSCCLLLSPRTREAAIVLATLEMSSCEPKMRLRRRPLSTVQVFSHVVGVLKLMESSP